MADEITIPAFTVTAVKNDINLKWEYQSDKVTMAGNTSMDSIQSIATASSGQALTVAPVSTAGWAMFRNLDASNYIEVGTGAGSTFFGFLKLKPGETTFCRLTTNAPMGRANTAAALLHIRILED